jgi:hypothetical protein
VLFSAINHRQGAERKEIGGELNLLSVRAVDDQGKAKNRRVQKFFALF